eukprot:scaffold143_cov260-Pinguiococcus_pyrenoidosus.AAC.34
MDAIPHQIRLSDSNIAAQAAWFLTISCTCLIEFEKPTGTSSSLVPPWSKKDSAHETLSFCLSRIGARRGSDPDVLLLREHDGRPGVSRPRVLQDDHASRVRHDLGGAGPKREHSDVRGGAVGGAEEYVFGVLRRLPGHRLEPDVRRLDFDGLGGCAVQHDHPFAYHDSVWTGAWRSKRCLISGIRQS